MKRKTLIKSMNWVLVGILGMLGFVGCEKIGMEEYGTPHADFTVKGTVVDKATGKPIAGIQVTIPRVDHHQRATSVFIPDQSVITSEVHDTLYTKDNGDFAYKYEGFPSNDSINVIIKFEDITEIKRYKTDSTKVTFFQSDLISGSGWYHGGATKEIEVKLDEQKRDE